jgi:RNA polymerase sigma-70 factor (ECF subfamily)
LKVPPHIAHSLDVEGTEARCVSPFPAASGQSRAGGERMVRFAPVSATIERMGSIPDQPLRFADVYNDYFHEVERWLRAMGIPDSDREDVAQEVFVVAQRKLPELQVENLAGWLFRVAAKTASDHRRRSWFRHLFARRSEVNFEEIVWDGAGPAEEIERAEARTVLDAAMRRLSEKRRTAFVLHEVEGYSCEEIAALLDVPVATIWTRLHHARKDFVAFVKRHERRRR